MVRVAYNNVYRALMLIKGVYGHSMSSEYVNNCIDGFGATQRKLTASRRGRLCLSTNTIIAPYLSSLYFMFASPWVRNGIGTVLRCGRLKIIRLPYAFKMRQDYLSTSYLDQKISPE